MKPICTGRTAVSIILVVMMMGGSLACAKKVKPLVPLTLESRVPPQAVTLTEQGTQAFQGKQFEEAKGYFYQAVTAAPESGQAHYNYALALNALGDTEQARQQFIEAANLAPGDKVIWDSPALRQYGNPQSPKAFKEHPTTNSRPTFGGGPR
ncbi:tetratricopeptide repeat protein [Nitrospira sp. KM1]|uniref:tetratricopeptide repeat protein n=1 Tax=Nitrospira sp. KM1 TaxID=1936990 RepID=UPI0015651F2C|nr:tetratricopeptide repeat protein [Nitrospira sp. KM1]